MDISNAKIVFFGGEPLGVPTLEELKIANITPDLIVCNPDRPAGRGQKHTPPPVKIWAEENGINIFQPTQYKKRGELETLTQTDWDLFVVVAYNFILPKWLLAIPNHGVLNVHPSLLPKLRGPSPIRTAIKDDLKENIGVSIMLMDEKMDHGPILSQLRMEIDSDYWPISGPELDLALAKMGGAKLAESIPAWLEGKVQATAQNHERATYTKQFKKSDTELALDPLNLPKAETARAALHHIYAFQGIGDSYFVFNKINVKIKAAELNKDGSLRILRVIPAGKSEMDFEHYLQSIS